MQCPILSTTHQYYILFMGNGPPTVGQVFLCAQKCITYYFALYKEQDKEGTVSLHPFIKAQWSLHFKVYISY